MLRRDDPIALLGEYVHDAGGAVQQLRAPVAVHRQQMPRRVVGADGDHRARYVVDVINADIAHVSSLAGRLAETQ